MEKKRPLSARHQKKLSRFLSKSYRDSFLETDVKSGIAYQIQALREKTGLSQTAFAKKLGKKQSFVSRLEDTEDGDLNINTLLEIAKALDIGLQVRFCNYIDVLERDISPDGMNVDDIFATIEKVQTVTKESLLPTTLTAQMRIEDIGDKLCRTNQTKTPNQQSFESATPNIVRFTPTMSSSACLLSIST